MYPAGHAYALLSPAQVDCIHCSALRILAEMGMQVENPRLLRALAEAGLAVDVKAERVRFPSRFVEQFITEAGCYDWERALPRVSSSAGIYHGLYHDPASGELVPWTEQRLACYIALARHLSHVDGATMLGCRLPVAPALEPLYERYYCWKYGAVEGGSIHIDQICPYLLDLYRARAAVCGQPLSQVFRATVYLVPPLKLSRHEAHQVAYFWERGLRVRVGGSMLTMGATAPVTLAGAVTLNLAEQLALCILEWALWGEKRLHLGASIAMMDMRTTIRPFGRPEMPIANLMTAQLARHYGASFSGHAGLTDAKLPSAEAGAQKALSAMCSLLAGGSVWIDAGLLSIDELCSPVQMVLDNELLSALTHFARSFVVNQEAIGLETILQVGPGGHFLDKEHTVRHFRAEQWRPEIWSDQMLRPWMEAGGRVDVDRAREVALQVQQDIRQRGLGSHIPESLEREAVQIIERASQVLVQ